VTQARAARSSGSGKVRVARLTDLAALGELSRLCNDISAATRSLGLPVSGRPIGVFSLFRLPLGAFQPHDLMYVYEEEGRLSGLIRVERDSVRDEWTIVELDGIGSGQAGDIRFRLVNQVLREARSAARGGSTSRAPTGTATSSCSCRRASPATATSGSSTATAIRTCPRRGRTSRPAIAGSGRRSRSTRCRSRACTPRRRRSRFQRLEGLRLPDWERQGTSWRVPRSSLAPILRFADVEAFVQESATGGKDGTQLDGFVQIGVAKEDQPHYLKLLARPEVDTTSLTDYALGIIRARTEKAGGSSREHGVIAPVRTYESPIDRRLEDAGFGTIATVTLLMKDTLVRVAEPALVPAGVR
jgi:hypothetical protein